MARIMVIGLTESGTRTRVNEDSFSCGDRVYPDIIAGSKEQTLGASDYTQVYIFTQGFGGFGACDFAGRIIQRVSNDFVAKLDDYKHPELYFIRFSRELIHGALLRKMRKITPRTDQGLGVSFKLFLIDANTVYVLNVGDTMIHLFRNNELYSLIDTIEKPSESDQPLYIGDHNAPFEDPVPNSMKMFDLTTSDIVLLTTEGFHANFHHRQLAEIIAAPDAFAANIRLAQIQSRQADNSENGTILAIKVRDLVLVEPDDTAKKNVERLQRSYGSISSEPASVPNTKPVRRIAINRQPEPSQVPSPTQLLNSRRPESDSNGTARKNDTDMHEQARKKRIKKDLRTFSSSILIGFLIGLATILVVWFFILK